MNKRAIVLGAGLAGLIAARRLQQQGFSVTVYEAADELPNNHAALMRFRSGAVSKAFGIPMKKVSVIKCVHKPQDFENAAQVSLLYADKNLQWYRSDRSLPLMPERAERYVYTGPSLPADLARGLDIRFGAAISSISPLDIEWDGPVISTLPMSVMFPLGLRAGYAGERLACRHMGSLIVLRAVCDRADAYVTVYDPGNLRTVTRASITGSELIFETNEDYDQSHVRWNNLKKLAAESASKEYFGITKPLTHIEVKKQQYAKMLPEPDKARRAFIHWLTANRNIYSLGRYATWRPGLLLDDVLADVDKIITWINGGEIYHVAKEAGNG